MTGTENKKLLGLKLIKRKPKARSTFSFSRSVSVCPGSTIDKLFTTITELRIMKSHVIFRNPGAGDLI